MNSLKKIAALMVSCSIVLGSAISAFAFTDMPDGEMGVAIDNAVQNGLLTGYDDDTVKPYESITRAQMSAIIVRAFGATENAQTSFGDIPDNAWYKDSVEKAVQMGAFQGDENGNFNPENNITFQETYTVLARVFQFVSRTTSSNAEVLKPADDCLDSFSDKDQIASWAADYAKAVVGNGGYSGIDGQLKPTSQISRGEFAMVMDQLVSLYIDEPGSYTTGFGDGSIVVRTGGVTIDGLNTNKNLILSYGIDSPTVVKNSTLTGCVVIYGGTDKTPIEGSNGKMKADESFIDISAHLYEVRIFAPTSETKISWLNENPRDVYIKSYSDTAVVNFGYMQ